tara:strand:- start:702 stop:878 length:177 start_codon:yes stop_codon:yes gene_type:complete
MEKSDDISKIKDKYYGGHKLDSEEMDLLMTHLKAMEDLLDEEKSQKESSASDGFTKYG